MTHHYPTNSNKQLLKIRRGKTKIKNEKLKEKEMGEVVHESQKERERGKSKRKPKKKRRERQKEMRKNQQPSGSLTVQ